LSNSIFKVVKLRRVKYLSVFLVLSLISCGHNDYSKENFEGSENLGSGLYAEHYLVANYGVGGEVRSVYITDSSTFKKLAMIYYDSDHIEFELANGQVIVNRMTDGRKSIKEEMHSVLVKSDTLNIAELKVSNIRE